jgi:hypothetical protein
MERGRTGASLDVYEDPARRLGQLATVVFVGPKSGVLSSANFGADVWRPAGASLGLKGFTFTGFEGCPPL